MWEELWSRVAALQARLAASGVGTRLTAGARRVERAAAGVWRALGPAVGRVRGTTRSLHPSRRGPAVLYRDGRVTLDQRGIVLHAYYVPFGAKRIPYEAVRDAWPWPLTGSRAFHARGPGWPRVWYQRDPRRGERDSAVVLDLGRWWRPVASPAEPAQVLAAIRSRIRPAPARRDTAR
jgi:hypothetical protein